MRSLFAPHFRQAIAPLLHSSIARSVPSAYFATSTTIPNCSSAPRPFLCAAPGPKYFIAHASRTLLPSSLVEGPEAAMHSTLSRAQSVFGFFTTVAFVVAALVAASDYFVERTPRADVKVGKVQVYVFFFSSASLPPTIRPLSGAFCWRTKLCRLPRSQCSQVRLRRSLALHRLLVNTWTRH
jgi:hypothetical protein